VPVRYGGEHGPDLDFVATPPSHQCAGSRQLAYGSRIYRVYDGLYPGLCLYGKVGRYDRDSTAGYAARPGVRRISWHHRVANGDLSSRFTWRLATNWPDIPAAFRSLSARLFCFLPVIQCSLCARRWMLEVLEAGGIATVQDGGRTGWRCFGVPSSGPMDLFAFQAANMLAGNSPNTAALEFGGGDLVLRPAYDCVIAVAGAGYQLSASIWDFSNLEFLLCARGAGRSACDG